MIGRRVWIDITVEEKEEGWELISSSLSTPSLPPAEEGEGKEEEESSTPPPPPTSSPPPPPSTQEEEEEEALLDAAAAATLSSPPPTHPPTQFLPPASSPAHSPTPDWSKWSSQLETLASMGFEARLDECVSLLERLWEEEGEEEKNLRAVVDTLLESGVQED